MKYQHVERITKEENIEIKGLLDGDVTVFPKLDGSNHCMWFDEEKGEPICASRNHILYEAYDHTKFYKYAMKQEKLLKLVTDFKGYIFYGEYMQPHVIKNYIDDVWGEWYVFDVYDIANYRYIPYEEYVEKFQFEERGIRYIQPIGTYNNPTVEELRAMTEENHYLMKESNIGEGIVVKNYAYTNPYGRSTWGKIVREEFRDKATGRVKDAPESIEHKIMSESVTQEFVSKEFHKFTTDRGVVWETKMIPEFLKYIWEEWWKDYSFEVVALYKGQIDMRELRSCASKFFVRYLNKL